MSNEDDIKIISIVKIFYKKRVLLMKLFLIFIFISYGFVLLSRFVIPPSISPFPEKYTPKAWLLFSQEKSSRGIDALGDLGGGLGGLAELANVGSGGKYPKLMEQMLESRLILDPVIEEFNLIKRYRIPQNSETIEKARKKVKSRISTNYNEESNSMTIGYTEYDKKTATKIVNRIVKLLVVQFKEIEKTTHGTEKESLEKKLSTVEAEIAVLEGKVLDFQKKYGVVDADQVANQIINSLTELNSSLVLKDIEIDAYKSITSVNDPVLLRLLAERRSLKKTIDEIEKGIFPAFESFPPLSELPDIALEYAHLEKDLLIKTNVYKILIQQYELAKIQLETQKPIFQVLDDAEAPHVKSNIGGMFSLIIATTMSLFLSILIIFFLEFLTNLKADPEYQEMIKKYGKKKEPSNQAKS